MDLDLAIPPLTSVIEGLGSGRYFKNFGIWIQNSCFMIADHENEVYAHHL